MSVSKIFGENDTLRREGGRLYLHDVSRDEIDIGCSETTQNSEKLS